MPKSPQDLVARARQDVTELSPAQARERLAHGAVALDVRDDHEFAEGHVPEAVHISRGFLEFRVGSHPATQDPDTEIIAYCKAGGRACLAAQTLQQLGYTNVKSIEGGYDGWVAAGEPVEGSAGEETEAAGVRDEEE